MIQWLRKRSLPARVLVYAAAAILAFALAAGVGAIGALMLRGDLNLPGREEPQSLNEQENAARPQEKDAAKQKEAAKQEEEAASQPEQKEVAAQLNEAEYVSKVGEIQNDSVETFLASHEKLLVYDALNADDVEQMQANKAALGGFANQVDDLEPPEEYGEHYEVFGSAINELREASQLAYNLAADPTVATQSGFDEYDRHVNEAAALLQQSNGLLGKEYKTIEGVQKVSPLS